MNCHDIVAYLKSLADVEIAENSQRYFKTGKGEYAEGDVFLGIRVPLIRKSVKEYRETSLSEINKLLKSEYHEVRLFSLLLLVYQFSKADRAHKAKIYHLYLKNIKYINNWDLVDSSASYIVGAYLFDKERTELYDLAASKNLWLRRIAIISTAYFISKNDYSDTLKIAKILLNDNEDLIHKAVGWMLREVGKRDKKVEEKFLNHHYNDMPRTMLRYAIEKFSKEQRKSYLNGEI
ncbi:MAG: DNA alkylation repair protein [Gammaproteobacteria bacterium]|nr:DNA alkylation repair protein [Gammaproteobacteria bacterium]